MFKEHYLKLVSFNVWANKKCLELIVNAGEEALDREAPSSFPSLRKTIYHIFNAETIWMQRLLEEKDIRWPASEKYETDFNSFRDPFIAASEKFVQYAMQRNENDFQSLLDYQSVAGIAYTSLIKDILSHVVNHSTYHRGQIITQLRMNGFTSIVATDFIAYCREADPVLNR